MGDENIAIRDEQANTESVDALLNKKIMKYSILIKSHTDEPDFEATTYADSFTEAANKFYEMLDEEFDLDYITSCMLEE